MLLRRLLLPALLVPGLLAAPVLTLPAAAARPVAADVVEIALAAPSGDPGRSALRVAGPVETLALTATIPTDDVGVVGVTWDPAPTPPSLDVAVRTVTAGTWSDWTPLDVEDLPTGGEARGARPGTSPLWIGGADGVQARVRLVSGTAPTGLRLALVDPGRSPADAAAAAAARPRSTAHAASVPDIRPRSAWGADESIRGGSPSYASRVRAVTLHHTASSSDYAQADVPALLRGFYAYHVKSNGWSDLGYNMLVDRFGTVWEGRAGGIGRAVIGAHAGGFNTGTVGISMIGTYETTQPSAAMLESVAQVAGWKLGSAGVDPGGSLTLTSAGSTRYPSGTDVTLPTLFSHRAVSTTSCPGTQGIAALPGLRERATALAAGAAPLPVGDEADGGLRVSAPSSADVGSTVDVVVRGVAGRPVQLWFAGTAAGATLRREGTFAEDGTFATAFTAESTQVLFAVSDGRSSPRVQTRVGTSPVPDGGVPSALGITGPVTAAQGTDALLTVTGPPGTRVTVWFRPHDESSFVRRREGALDPSGTFTTTYVAAEQLTYFAMSSTVTSADSSTDVGPVPNGLHVTAPATSSSGADVHVVVQGTPGDAVELWFSRAGGPFVRRREGVLAADGTYRTTWSSPDAHTVYAVAGARTSTRVTTLVPGSVPYAAAGNDADPSPAVPVVDVVAAGDAGATVPLGVSGRPGAPVAVWFRARGEEVFTRRRVGVLDDAGRYTSSFSGATDYDVYATSGTQSSRDAATIVRPTLVAPARATLGSVVLTGRARPGDAVVVEQRRRSNPAVVPRTTTAGATGTWRLPVWLSDESTFRPVAAGRTGATSPATRVSPVLVAPATSGRGRSVALSGTARPGSVVEVLVRRQGGTAFAVARTLRADAAGRFRTTAALAVSHRLYARADGLASAQRIVSVR